MFPANLLRPLRWVARRSLEVVAGLALLALTWTGLQEPAPVSPSAASTVTTAPESADAVTVADAPAETDADADLIVDADWVPVAPVDRSTVTRLPAAPESAGQRCCLPLGQRAPPVA